MIKHLKYLVDTNVLSEPTKSLPNSNVLSQITRYRDNIATATVVWHELRFGCQRLPRSRRRTQLEDYLGELEKADLPVLPYTKEAAEWHAKERARLTSLGKTPPFPDGQIAAIAKVHELVLVTANVADYQYFADLVIEDWREIQN